MKQLEKMRAVMLFFILTVLYTISDIYAQNILSQKQTKIEYLLSQAQCSKWQTVKQNQGVVISTRWLSFGDTLKTRELSLQFTVDASAYNVLHNLRSKSALEQWNKGVRELNVFKKSDSTWVTHMVYDIPYPLSQQDLVTKNTIIKDNNKIVIDVNAEPEIIELRENVNRQKYYFGQWKISTLQNQKTKVSFSAISFSKSNIPRFIRDPIVQNKLLNSFIKLKELSANEAYLAILIKE